MSWDTYFSRLHSLGIEVHPGVRTAVLEQTIPMNGTYMHILTNLALPPDFAGMQPIEVARARRDLRKNMDLLGRYVERLQHDSELLKKHTSPEGVLHIIGDKHPTLYLEQLLTEQGQ